MSLKGKVAIVSGASRGIGREIALELAREGADISFSYLNSKKEADGLLDQIRQIGPEARVWQVDIKDFDAVARWVSETKEYFKGLDILINNAGITKDKALMFMEKEDWREVIDTNLGGAYNLTHAAIMGFIKQKSGAIINISSVSGTMGMARQTNYSASKSGVIGFTKSLAKEAAAYNIRVNAIAAGFIETDMTKTLKDSYRQEMINRIPLKRFGRAEDVAKAVKFLVSDKAGYITGQVVVIDGGLSIA